MATKFERLLIIVDEYVAGYQYVHQLSPQDELTIDILVNNAQHHIYYRNTSLNEEPTLMTLGDYWYDGTYLRKCESFDASGGYSRTYVMIVDYVPEFWTAIQFNGEQVPLGDIPDGEPVEARPSKGTIQVHDGIAYKILVIGNQGDTLVVNQWANLGVEWRPAVTREGVEVLLNKTLVSPVINGVISGTAILDESDLGSNSSVHLATQRSIKAYVDDVAAAKQSRGQPNGIASLDADTRVPVSELPVLQGSTETDSGVAGVVPAPEAGLPDKFLRNDGTWASTSVSSLSTNLDTNGWAINESMGPTVTSGLITPLLATKGNTLRITGSSQVMGFGNAPAGTRRTLIFASSIRIVNGPNISMLANADVVTEPGDNATFVSEGSGRWKCLDYNRVSGLPLISGSSKEVTALYPIESGDFVNLTMYSGSLHVRKADASILRQAHGFVRQTVDAGEELEVYFEGVNDVARNLTPGVDHFLSAVAPGRATSVVSETGTLVQNLGLALSTTSLNFKPTNPIMRG